MKRNNNVLKNSAILCFVLFLFQACRQGADGIPEGENELAAKMDYALSLSGTEQLYLLEKNDGNQSGRKDDTSTPESPSSPAEKLYIIDENGDSKTYLRDLEFDRFFVIKRGTEVLYLARLSAEEKSKYRNAFKGRWFILKNGEKPRHVTINVKKEGSSQVWREETEFVGQTETNGGLVFSDGSYVDLQGKPLSFGKNIRDIEKATFVSGDYVALRRKIKGEEHVTLIYVSNDPKATKRRSYKTKWLPDFVQISKNGNGLVSDAYQKETSSVQTVTNISKLEAEFEDSVIKAGTRGQAYQAADLGDCLYFNSSVRLGDGFKKPGALITCQVPKTVVTGGHTAHIFEYQLMRITASTTPGQDWDLKMLLKLKEKKRWTEEDRYKVFTPGDGFILMNNDGDLIFVPSKSMTKNTKKIATGLATVIEIRPSLNAKDFIVVGEKVNGDSVMMIFSGVDGSLKDTKVLDL